MIPSVVLEHAEVVAPIVAVALLLVARHTFGRWPDLWRLRRVALPLLARADDQPDVDDVVPDKSSLPLQEREFAGVIDATPREVRAMIRSKPGWGPCNLASIQWDEQDGERVYEVGSYAYRETGILSSYQTHVRLTPRASGHKTALWAHREYNPWTRPRAHYRSERWDAADGVWFVATMLRDDPRYVSSDQASELVAERGYCGAVPGVE